MEMTAPIGLEPSRHLHHHDDEGLYVLEGNITFYVGEETYAASPGTFVFLPRGVPHSYTFETNLIRMLAIIAPGGVEEHFRDPRFSESAKHRRYPHHPPNRPTWPSRGAWLRTWLVTAPRSSVLQDHQSKDRTERRERLASGEGLKHVADPANPRRG